MHLLVIGGTVFLGRHLVLQALAAGHKVTTLNRGTLKLPEQDGVEKLIDDRQADLDVLTNRKFDAVIDTCGYLPEVVRHSAEVLAQSVDTYLFVSTISVYGNYRKADLNESDPIKYTEPGEKGDYGTLKADCEMSLMQCLPDKSVIVRPGLIVGPYDPTDRFTYWPARIARGGDVLAPGSPEAKVQFIDVRDLSSWMIDLVASGKRGVYNATGPSDVTTLGEFFEISKSALHSDSNFIWVNESELEAEQIKPFSDLPLWVPSSLTDFAGFFSIDSSKAYAEGLTTRPVAHTVRHTYLWDKERDPNLPRTVGLNTDKEQRVLDRLRR